jgi:regulator of sirC expression with transglutaminase-like and TPR domain
VTSDEHRSDAADDVDDLSLERRAFDTDRDDFSLLRAAALLPRVEGRDVDVGAVVAVVDGYAEQIADRVSSSGSVQAVYDVLFASAGFKGDQIEYEHPDNSFLDVVCRRRRGLPIALSLLTVEAATRAGIKAWGLALPGHFLAAIFVDDERFTVIDAFAGGTLLSPDEVARRASVPESELGEVLQPATPLVILTRMLVNLTVSYNRRGQHLPLSRSLDRLLILRPNDPRLLVERAAVRRLLLDDEGALNDMDAAEDAGGDDELIARAVAGLRAEYERGQILN